MVSTMAGSSMLIDNGLTSNINYDIGKVYCPPVKSYEYPQNNPFNSGIIGGRSKTKPNIRNNKIDYPRMSKK